MTRIKIVFFMMLLLLLVSSIFASATSEVPEIIPNQKKIESQDYITITFENHEAKIFYTLDGSDPTQKSIPYTSPISPNIKSFSIKAIAMTEKEISKIAKRTYTVEVAVPEISPGVNSIPSSQLITLSCKDKEASIFYTVDGSDPRMQGARKYSEPFKLSANGKVRVVARVGDMISDEEAKAFTLLVPPPRILSQTERIEAGAKITIECDELDAVIMYRINGEVSQRYTGPFQITESATISAAAILGNSTSETVHKKFEIVLPAPQIFPSESVIASNQPVTIVSSVPNVIIYYSINGGAFKSYSGPFLLPEHSVVHAKARKGTSSSEVIQKRYTLSVTPPEIIINDGALQISAKDQRATIRYSLEGTEVTNTSKKYLPSEENKLTGSYYIKAKAYIGYAGSDQVSYIKLQPPKIIVEQSSVIKITSDIPSATIFYTIDGSPPTVKSEKYNEPILYSSNTKVSAIAFLEGEVSEPESRYCMTLTSKITFGSVTLLLFIIASVTYLKKIRIKIKEKMLKNAELEQRIREEMKKQEEAERKVEEERQAEIEEKRRLEQQALDEKRRLEQQALDEKRKRAKQAGIERKRKAWEENRKFFVQSQWQDFCFYFEYDTSLLSSYDEGKVKLKIINSNGDELLYDITRDSVHSDPFVGRTLVEIRVAISKILASLVDRGFEYSNTVIDSIVAGIQKNLAYHVKKEFIFRNETKSHIEANEKPNIEKPLSKPENRNEDVDNSSLQIGASGSLQEPATPKMMNKNNENNLGLQSILAELDGMIGLDRVKEEIHTIVNQVRVNQMKRAAGIKTDMGSMHLVFSGNPGTGKTTVARIVGRIYTELGVLKKGTFLEVSRSKLCAEYLGQTAIKTEAVVKSAIGGVLFIDEAYSLYQSNQDDYGKEAIDTLLKLMEDQRKNLVVIVAGYTNLIQTFLSSNPGLESRFTTTIHFEDYNASDMYRIFEVFCKKDGYTPSPGASTILKEYFQDLYDARSDNFANAREVRNAYEKALKNQSNRLAKVSHSPSRRELLTLDEEDVSRLK